MHTTQSLSQLVVHLTLSGGILMKKHSHSSEESEKKPAQRGSGGGLTSRASPSPTPQSAPTPSPSPRSESPSSAHGAGRPHDEPKPVRSRVPAVTSKARTTAPEKDNRSRRRYPSTRQRPY